MPSRDRAAIDKSTTDTAAPPLGFLPLKRLPAQGSGMMARPAEPDRQRLQVFSTSWRVHPPRACWPCFMPDPLLGFALQSLAPLAQPYAVSGVAALLTFKTFLKPIRQPLSPSQAPKRRARSGSSHKWISRQSAPRLQGLAPYESPPHRTGGLGRSEHVALLGFSPPGCSPSLNRQRPSSRLPS